MSSGVLCVIVIPTEDEEFQIQQLKSDKNLLTTGSTKTLSTTPIKDNNGGGGGGSIGSGIGIINNDKKQQNANDIKFPNVLNENHTETLERVNTAPYDLEKNTKIDGIDNGSFEIDMEFTTDNNLNNKRNKSADDFKDIYNPTKDTNSKDELGNHTSKKKLNSSSLFLDLPTDSNMVTVLREILRKLKVDDISWSKIREDKYYQVMFTMECDIKYENLLIMLNEWGIGHRKGSTLSIANCTFNSYKNEWDDRKDSTTPEDYAATKNGGLWNRFMNNLTARLNVAQIVRDVRQDATITFDFTILVISAAVLASFGLVENSVIFLTSSMLISPLMGPIIAGIFGTVIKDGALTSLGVINELIGLFIATFVGFLFGLIVCSIEPSYNIRAEGLTAEILSRTSLHSVFVGIITATVSGAAAAVGILGGNVGSLVGVAISASLLPPAVNAGLLWALSCIFITSVPDENSKILTQIGVYSNDLATELAILGLISMLLTISNIICVYVVGVVILKIKEIAPIVSNKQFWRHDIRIARDYNRNIFADNSSLASEYASLPKDDQNVIKRLNSIKIDDLAYQNTWSPSNLQTIQRNQNLSDLEKYYSNTVHTSRYGGGRANSICAEKIRSHLDDVSNYMRRASMPFEVLTRSPKTSRKSIKKLPTIQASPNETPTPTSTLEKRPKFVVTPVLDSRKIEFKNEETICE